MKSKLLFTSTVGMDRDTWLQFRTRGLGASEVGSVLGLDDYTSSLELFYRKIGEVPTFDVESMAAFMGREQEDLIAQMWQYWDGDQESMIANYRADKVVRRCQRVNAYIQHPEFPWLYVSLDRKMLKHAGRGEGTLELKTITAWEADKWEAGIPPKWLTQVNTQMLVPEFDHGEMAVLQDARKLHVLPFERSDTIVQHIVVRTKEFWDRVVEARKLVNEKYHPSNQWNQRRLDELTAAIDALAPEPDGTLAYSNYLAERHQRPEYAERSGNLEELEHAQQHRALALQIDNLEEQKRQHENALKVAMSDHQLLTFGLHGKVYWSLSDRGRTFRNKVKV